MSERGTESIVEWLEIDIAKLSGLERVGLITEIMDTLTAQELGEIRTQADKKRTGKLREARTIFIKEMREKAAQLDLTFDEAAEMVGIDASPKRERQKREIKPKYRSPAGEEWSGRGRIPVWLKQFEESGHARDEFLIKDERVGQ